jgi:spermidine/putrescine transport system substrate-binding protein
MRWTNISPSSSSSPATGRTASSFSLVTRFGFLGVAYNTDALTEAEAANYNVFWDPKLTGKVGHFDWHLPNLGQISLLNGNASPYDIDEAAWPRCRKRPRRCARRSAASSTMAAPSPR